VCERGGGERLIGKLFFTTLQLIFVFESEKSSSSSLPPFSRSIVPSFHRSVVVVVKKVGSKQNIVTRFILTLTENLTIKPFSLKQCPQTRQQR
jgi:hypothetical protein